MKKVFLGSAIYTKADERSPWGYTIKKFTGKVVEVIPSKDPAHFNDYEVVGEMNEYYWKQYGLGMRDSFFVERKNFRDLTPLEIVKERLEGLH